MMSTRRRRTSCSRSASSRPSRCPTEGLGVGEVGYLITGVKDVRQSRVGDTVTDRRKPATESLGGYRDPKPMVFSGLYPIDGSDYPLLRDALDKLRLNDAALVYEPEIQRRARLRLPLRLPRPAAPGDHPRAARARVRPRPDLHRAQRRLPRGHRGRHRARRHQPVATGRRAEDRRDLRAGRQGDDHRAERVHRRDHGAVPGAARHARRHGLPVRDPRRAALHAAARRDHLRLLRPAEVAHPRLRQPRLRAGRRAGRPTWSRSTSCCRASRSTRSPRSCTRTRPTPTARR